MTLVLLAVTVIFLRQAGLRMDWGTVDYTLRPFVPASLRLLLLGVLSQAAYRAAASWRRGRRWADLSAYLRAIVEPRWLLLWVRLYLAYAAAFYCYNWLKVSTPLLNERLWDGQFLALDRLLHLGLSPTVLAVELVQGTPVVGLLDWWYSLWILTVLYSIAFFVTSKNADLRAGFLFSCCLLWIVGAWIYVALPALGPIYAFTDQYREILPELTRAPGGHRALWENYQILLAGRSGQIYAFNPTRGIAAMPSLHVGAHVLLALWSRRYARALYLPFVVASVLTFAGSLVTGWHYAIDGYLGALLAACCYWLAVQLERPAIDVLDRPASEPQPTDRPAAGG